MSAKALLPMVLFGIAIALLIAASAALTGFWQYRALNRQIAEQILDTAQAIQKYVVEQRIARLEDVAKTIAEDPSFVSYISQALANVDAGSPTADTASIRDLLEDRRRTYNLDAAVILDASGKHVVGVGDAMFAARDSAALPVVALVRQTASQASRISGDDKRVFLITATPLMRGADHEALLLTGARVDAAVIKNIAQISGADLALLIRGPSGQHVAATTLATQDVQGLTTLLAAPREQEFDDGASRSGSRTLEFDIDGRSWSARVASLDADKISLMVLVPPTRLTAIAMTLASPLIVGAVVAFLLVTILLLLIWQKVLRPLAVLDDFAARAMGGDHALQVKPTGARSLVRIASAFNQLLLHLDRYRIAPGVPRRRATDRN